MWTEFTGRKSGRPAISGTNTNQIGHQPAHRALDQNNGAAVFAGARRRADRVGRLMSAIGP